MSEVDEIDDMIESLLDSKKTVQAFQDKPKISFPKEQKRVQAFEYKNVKAPFDMIPPIALFEMAKAFGLSDDKCSMQDWQNETILFSETYRSMMRHMLSWYSGEDIDGESGVHHLAHVMQNCAFMLHMINNGQALDDRIFQREE